MKRDKVKMNLFFTNPGALNSLKYLLLERVSFMFWDSLSLNRTFPAEIFQKSEYPKSVKHRRTLVFFHKTAIFVR